MCVVKYGVLQSADLAFVGGDFFFPVVTVGASLPPREPVVGCQKAAPVDKNGPPFLAKLLKIYHSKATILHSFAEDFIEVTSLLNPKEPFRLVSHISALSKTVSDRYTLGCNHFYNL